MKIVKDEPTQKQTGLFKVKLPVAQRRDYSASYKKTQKLAEAFMAESEKAEKTIQFKVLEAYLKAAPTVEEVEQLDVILSKKEDTKHIFYGVVYLGHYYPAEENSILVFENPAIWAVE